MTGTGRRLRVAASTLVAMLSLLAAVGAPQALAGSAHLSVIARADPSVLKPQGTGSIRIVITNLGDEPVVAGTTTPLVISDRLPAGVIASAALKGGLMKGARNEPETPRNELVCKPLPALSCSFSGTLEPYSGVVAQIQVESKEFAGGINEVSVEGGNVATQTVPDRIASSTSPVPFGVERFEVVPEEENGQPDNQAGTHPFALTTTLELNQIVTSPAGEPAPAVPSMLKNLSTVLPRGLIGNPLAIPQCSEADFETESVGNSNLCPPDTAIGAAALTFKAEGRRFPWQTEVVPVFNLTPAQGEPARLGFEFIGVPVTIKTSVLTGNGYAVKADVKEASETAEVLGTTLTIWGTPGSEAHDNSRGWFCLAGGIKGHTCEHLGEKNPKPYLTMPTYCSEALASSAQAQSWALNAITKQPEAPVAPVLYEQPPLVGCSALPFNPELSVFPDSHAASTPTGLNVDVTIPQSTTLSTSGVAEADVKETTLVFPEGLQANAGAADGLAACKVENIGFEGANQGESREQLEATIARQRFTPGTAECPGASQLGELEVHSPVLEHNLVGHAYLAEQDTNPFASPLVVYFLAEDKTSGVRLKLAGETQIEPNGQLIGVFKNTPPVPAETIDLHLTPGERATFANPPYCHAYTAVAKFTTWSGQHTERTSSFTPTEGPNGTPCQTSGKLPFSPSIQAGSVNNRAGAYSGFTLTIKRPDGQQSITGVSTTLPEGLAAKLASVTPCQEPANEQPWNCGEASKIGVARTSSGLGKDPVNLEGQAYLTTGYDGAPFGLLVQTNVVAGPFHLGNIDVRSRINVNEETAAVTVTTDPGPHHELGGRPEELPTIFKGVPVQLKALNVEVNKPEFQFNPTDCAPMSIGASLTGEDGPGSEALGSTGFASSIPFQVTNCSSLPFAPKFSASVDSQGSKALGVGARITVESSGIGAEGIRKVFLTVPKILPARLKPTLNNACLDSVFVVNPAACPEDSFIGKATVTTPVLNNPLTGPAIIVSHGNAAFPDVEFVLQSEGIHILLDGKTDIKNGITYSRFESAPDAPFTKFVTELPAGPHSIFTDNTEIVPNYNVSCQNILAPTEITAQDGRVYKQETQFVPTSKCVKPASVSALTKALQACKKKYKGKKNKAKLQKCEKAARKKFAKKSSTKHSTKHTTKHSKRR
jgi:hypothetical protein